MSKLSRRSLVASASALPALAVPALAANALNNPDAELLRLGTELEAVEKLWSKQRAFDLASRAAQEAACIRAGLRRDPFPDSSSEEIVKGWDAYWAKRESIPYEGKEQVEADTNSEGESIAWNNIHARMYDLIDKIFSHKPTTIDGVAVLVRAEVMDNAELWDPGVGDSTNRSSFLEALCDFLGIVPAALRRAA
jgi:hypothetical protein